MSMPGFDRAQAAYEAAEPDDTPEECPDLSCGECRACKDAEREDWAEEQAEAAREDARLGL